MTLPIPDDPYYDYLPIDGADIEVGMDILSVITSGGEVTFISSPAVFWIYLTEMETPWGVPVSGVALFPIDPEGQLASWWQRFAVWTREDKPDDGFTLVGADGSRWIYSANDTDGKMVCYKSGAVYQQNQRLSRGAITTDPGDRYTADDAEWDWMPVLDGATVDVGEQIRFTLPQAGVVTSITTATLVDGYDRTTITAGTDIGWFDSVTDATIPRIDIECTFYRRLLKPATNTQFRAPLDESRWVFSGGAYFCWDAGTMYPQGTMLPRGSVPQLLEISSPVTTPPSIREVLQTPDDLVGDTVLTTSESVVAGDVLIIVWTTSDAAPSVDPTSSAGTVTQVGADETDGDGDGIVQVWRCPVGTSGEHTVEIPEATDPDADVLAAVIVVTDDAEVDGFASTNYTDVTSSASPPSVSPTGTADLLVAVFFDMKDAGFSLTGSGLTARANPTGGNASLAVGTVELESDDPTGTYTVTVTPTSKPAAVTVALKKP